MGVSGLINHRNIRRWYKKFEKSGCLYNRDNPDLLGTSKENVQLIQEAFQP